MLQLTSRCGIHLLYVLLILYLHFNFVNGITHSACPIACICSTIFNNPYFKVKCDRYWDEIPSFSINVRTLIIKYRNFGVLTKPKECTGLTTVKTLSLSHNKISEVAGNAFECVPQTETINLAHNSINVIKRGTFGNLAVLKSLFLNTNQLTVDAIGEIARIKQLLSLEIAGNGMTLTNNALEPLARSSNLYNMDISNSFIHETFGNVIKPFRSLVVLKADNCRITSFQDDTFAGFSHLIDLSLKDNPLNFISNFTFTHLTTLETLDLSGSIQGLSQHWLNYLPPLQSLSLQRNVLQEVPQIVMKLTSLMLAENNITSIEEHSFHGLQHLQYLDISSSHIKYMDSRAFQSVPNLTRLHLSRNALLEGSLANLTASLVNTSIRKLYLSLVYIPKISHGMFQQFSPNRLVTLAMISSNIRIIKPYSLKNFDCLQTLKLSANKLTHLERYTFAGMYLLRKLDLSRNQLNTFFAYNTKDLNNLITLNLASNNIYDIGGKIMGMNLKGLFLSNNRLTRIGSGSFVNTINIETLALEGNQLSNIHNGTFSHLSNITHINLSKNTLSALPLHRSGLSSLTKVVSLDMSSNEGLCNDPNVVMKTIMTFTEMERLSIHHCSLKELLPNMFKDNERLEYLNVASNKISYLEPTAFGHNSRMQQLILSTNYISYVTYKNFVNLPALRELQLEGNPLMCTCEVLFIVQAVKTNLLYMGQLGLKGMRCQAPDDVRRKSLAQIHMDLTDCEDQWTRVLIPIASCFAGFVALSISFIIWRYRWHFKYFCFLAKARRRRYHEIQDERHYEFDAFVAYSERDLWWVRQHLLPNLEAEYEGQDGLCFCVHHRDWLAGRDIVDNIATSIEQSRRTIIVLSDNFATSQWCQYELAIAQLRLDTDGTCRELLVMILLNDISPENLTPRLRFIMTSKTYLPWSDDPEEQALFWGALRRSLLGPNTVQHNFLCFRGNEA